LMKREITDGTLSRGRGAEGGQTASERVAGRATKHGSAAHTRRARWPPERRGNGPG
jgi:hypothetical protein